MSNIILDFDRVNRCGVEEAVFCESKTSDQITDIVGIAVAEKRRLLLTRLTPDKLIQLPVSVQTRLTYDKDGAIAVLGDMPHVNSNEGRVAVVSGGASDHKVCTEIATTLHYHGIYSERFEDVGVAALWRLTQRLEQLSKADIIIAVAGMEAALPTVLSGLISTPIIAVPTSVGYGVAEGGHLALNSCLGSCASGITVVNIDNGFGAACAAIRLVKQFTQRNRVTE